MAEAAPEYTGHRMVRDLARVRIQTTLIPDSNVFAMMSRMTKARPRSCCQLGSSGGSAVRVCIDACTCTVYKAPGSSELAALSCVRVVVASHTCLSVRSNGPCKRQHVSVHALLASALRR